MGSVAVRMGRPAVIGRVVDQEGKGVPGVILEFASVEEGAVENLLSPGDQCSLLSGKDGKFELYGNFAGRPIEVNGYKRGYKKILRERVSPGDLNVVLRIEGEKRIQGVFVVDSLEAARSLRVVFVRKEDGERFLGRVRRTKKEGPGEWFSFAWERVNTGDWQVRIEWERVPLWTGEVTFSRGEKEFRFHQPVDLRGKFREWRFRVLGRDGKSLGGRVSLLVSGPEGKVLDVSQPFLGKGGFRVFPLPSEYAPLALRAPGFFPADVRGLAGTGEEVRLEKGVPVDLELRVPPNLWREENVGFKLRIYPEFRGRSGLTEWERQVLGPSAATLVVFVGGRKRTVFLPGYGIYLARWSVCKLGDLDWSDGEPVKEAEPERMVVEKGKKHRFVLVLPEGPARKAVARLLGE